MLNKFYFYIYKKCAMVKAHYYDFLLGIETTKHDDYAAEDTSLHKDMYDYQAVAYGRLEKMVAYLNLTRNDVFVDLGCGKGRVVFFLAQQRLKKVIGVELSEQLIGVAKNNLSNLRIKRTPVELINGDAATFNVKDVTIFFMFNPFAHKTLEQVINNIKESLTVNYRKIRIIYTCHNSQHKNLLDSQDWLELEGQIQCGHCLVWRNKVY